MTKLEKELRDQIQAQEEFIDTDMLWANVEPHLTKKKKRRFLPMFFFIGVIAIGGFLTYTIVNNKSTRVEETSKNIAENTNAEVEVDQTITTTQEISTTTQSRSIQSTPHHVEATNSETENSLDFDNKTYANNESSIVQAVDLFNIKSKLKPGNKTPLNLIFNIQNDDSESTIKTENSISSNSNVPISTLHDLTNSQTKSTIQTSTSENISTKKNSSNALFHLSNSIAPLSNLLLPPNINTKYSHAVLVQKQHNFEYFVSGGISTSPISLSSQENEWDSHYQNRDNAETSLVSWHLRAGVQKRLFKNWSIKAGILLNKMNRSSSTSLVTNEIIQLENVVIEKIIGPQGIEDVYGTVDVNQITTQEVQRISTFTAIDFNLSLLREFRIATHASIVLGPMISYNLTYKQKGNIHPVENEEYNLALDDQNWFKSNLGLSLGIETGLRYQINNNIILESTLLVDHKLKGINESSYGINDKRHAIHVSIGISQSF